MPNLTAINAAGQGNHTHLKLLVWLRVLALLGQTIAVIYSALFLHIQLPFKTLIIWITVYAIINATTYLRLKACSTIGSLEFLIQLLLDVLILSILLYYSGGGANPFVSLYLVPITISAITLPAISTWALTLISITCYSLILWTSDPLHTHTFHAENFSLHTIGMWLGFIIGALLVSYFVVRMGTTIRNQQKALMDQRTEAIQSEQMVKLGALAASTAHELGTPLGTMQLLVDQLKTETRDSAHFDPTLAMLCKQLERCKTALSLLSSTSGYPPALGGTKVDAITFVSDILNDWQQQRPDVMLSVHWEKTEHPPNLLSEITLQQAIRNILNNSADASPNDIRCIIDWNTTTVKITIEDRGPGIPVNDTSQIGKMPVESENDGLGIGLFLSHNIIRHLGGSIRLANLEHGGLQTRINLPAFEHNGHSG